MRNVTPHRGRRAHNLRFGQTRGKSLYRRGRRGRRR